MARVRVTPKQFAKRMKRLARRSEPRSVARGPARHIAESIERDVLHSFDRETTPQITTRGPEESKAGSRWAPLADATVEARQRKAKKATRGRGARSRFTAGLVGKVKPLQDTGLMRISVAHDVVRRGKKVVAIAGVVGTGPEYSVYHQKGTTRGIPARPFVGMMRRTLKAAFARIRKHVTKK